MRVQLRRQVAQTDREHRGEHGREARHQRHVQREDHRVRRLRADPAQCEQQRHHHDRARDDQGARADAVVDLADLRTEDAHRQTARHHQQAGLELGEASQVLQVERKQDHRAQERHEARGHQHQRHRVVAVPQRAQVEQRPLGALQDELVDREGRDQHHSTADEQRRLLPSRLADLAQAVDEAAEAQGGEHDAEPADRGRDLLADVLQLPVTEEAHRQRDRQHDREDQAPRAEVQQHPGHGRAQRRSARHRQRDLAHHPSPVLRRHHRHQRRHQQRHHHRRTARLDHPAHEQDLERRRHPGDQRAEAERAHRRGVRRAGGDPLQEPARHRDDRCHRQHEHRQRPLGGRRGDREVGHQPRHRVDHDRLVEDHDEGRRDQQLDDERRTARGRRPRRELVLEGGDLGGVRGGGPHAVLAGLARPGGRSHDRVLSVGGMVRRWPTR